MANIKMSHNPDIKEELFSEPESRIRAELERNVSINNTAERISKTKAGKRGAPLKRPSVTLKCETPKRVEIQKKMTKEERIEYTNQINSQYVHNVSQIIDFFAFDKCGIAYMAQASFRAAWIASIMSTIMRGTGEEYYKVVDSMLHSCPFDYEKEIMDNRWVIALTGSLYNDIRVNYVAKDAMTGTPREVMQLGIDLINSALSLWMNNVEGDMSECTLLPTFPRFTNSRDIILEYCEMFASTSVGSIWKMEKPRDFTARCLSETDKDLTTYLNISYDTTAWAAMAGMKQCSSPVRGTIDTRMVQPEKAMHDVRYPQAMVHNRLCRGKSENKVTKKHLLAEYDSLYYHSLTTMTSLIDAERREYFQERERCKARTEEQTSLAKSKTEPAPARPEVEQPDQEPLLNEIKELSTRVKDKNALIERLEKRLADTEHDKRDAELKTEEALVQSSVLAQDVKSLQDTLWDIQNPQEETTEKVEELDASVFADFNIVCVGGHPAWVNDMKTIHSNLRIYDFNVPDSALANADAIWIQSFNISHPLFFRCNNVAITHNIPLHYFSGTGRAKCKKELILSTNEMRKKQQKE